MKLRYHHMRQEPVAGMNQWLRVYRPFTGRGVGVVIWRHEISLVWEARP